MEASSFSQSFPPLIGKEARVLILGSLPGKESLRKQEYYAHPRNAFWPILFQLFAGQFSTAYQARVDFAKSQHVALWDVCQSAIRPGSLDANISKVSANDIDGVLKNNPSITHVAFNGQKAAQLYDKYFERQAHLSYACLLSTSPANASYSFEQKLANWGAFLKMPM